MACACKTLVPASPEVAGSQGGFAEILRLERTSRCPAWDHLHISGLNTQFPSALPPSQANGYLFEFQICFLLRDGCGPVQDLYPPGIDFVPTPSASLFPSSVFYLLKQLLSGGSGPLPDIEHRHQILSSGCLVTPSPLPT